MTDAEFEVELTDGPAVYIRQANEYEDEHLICLASRESVQSLIDQLQSVLTQKEILRAVPAPARSPVAKGNARKV